MASEVEAALHRGLQLEEDEERVEAELAAGLRPVLNSTRSGSTPIATA